MPPADDSEAWKGEQETPETALGPFGHFFRKETDAERAARQERERIAMPIGEMLFQSLPRYEQHHPCPKCGNTNSHLQYVAASDAPGEHCAKHAGTHEHLHRQCKRCHYAWIERCLSEDV